LGRNRDCEVSLSFPSQISALRSERGLSRAVESPLVRGGLTLVGGVLIGNVLGFGRVALAAALLGMHSRADSLAVAMGPVDTLNSVLINSIVFAFVPMLTAREGAERVALFRQLARAYLWISSALCAVLVCAAPWLMRALAPGLDAEAFQHAVAILRILAFSSIAAGTGAVHCAILYTDRRFAPTAFYQAALNAFTILSALALWKALGVYAFALGYTLGAWAQLGIVWWASRSHARVPAETAVRIPWGEMLSKPAFFVVYAAGLGLNITFTRAYATHIGPGMAAALDYCMRGVGVPLALLVNPLSNSLLPEIARLRSLGRPREALRLIDRTIALTAAIAIACCLFALVFRETGIRIIYQRGQFTAQETRVAAAVFLGLGPSLVGWSLIEIASRSLFALDRRWPQVISVAAPLACNVLFTIGMHSASAQLLGAGASLGLSLGFVLLFTLLHTGRKRWV
jgi:putative peptidoglycan lipid II flippase